MKPLEKLMAHIYSEKHCRDAGVKVDFGDFTDKELFELLSELEATQKDTERLNKLQALTKGYGNGWILRDSFHGRGVEMKIYKIPVEE